VLGFNIGPSKERARRELKTALSSIADRLDALETTPAPTITEDNLKAALAQLLTRLEERFEVADARVDGLETSLADEERRVKALTFAVSEGIERVARHERRIHATVKRARKELEAHGFESPGLEAEAAELHIVDGDRSEQGEVPTLPAGVEPPFEEASSIKGVSAETLRRVRGF